MNIPPKYEDVVAKLDAALGREAALREEVSCLKAVLNGMEFKQVDDMVSDGVDACLFLGQESARIIKGIQAERDALREELESIKASVDGYDSPEHAAQVADELGHQCNVLQQRLTVAERRESEAREELLELSRKLDVFYSRSHGIKNLSAIEDANDKSKALQQRLTVAEQLLRDAKFLIENSSYRICGASALIFGIEASLKSAEGGGDDSAHDRAYRNGLMQGYNLAINGSEKEYQEAVSRYSGGKDAE